MLLPVPEAVPPQVRGAFDARCGGVSCRQLMYDQVLANRLGERAMPELDPDIDGGPARSVSRGPLLDAMDFRQLEWPGHGAPENSSCQDIDRESVRAEEYEEFILDPTGFLFETYLPRVAGAYDGLQPLGAIAGNCYLGLASTALAFQSPAVVGAFERLRAAGAGAARMFALNAESTPRLAGLGYPPFAGDSAQAPYDVPADYMRGARKMMTDLYRRPEKVHAAVRHLAENVLRKGGKPILAASSPIPDETPVENARAMFRAISPAARDSGARAAMAAARRGTRAGRRSRRCAHAAACRA